MIAIRTRCAPEGDKDDNQQVEHVRDEFTHGDSRCSDPALSEQEDLSNDWACSESSKIVKMVPRPLNAKVLSSHLRVWARGYGKQVQAMSSGIVHADWRCHIVCATMDRCRHL